MTARVPRLSRLDDPAPHGRLLSNGRYRVLLTGAGSGASSCAGHALTNWRADRSEDGDGVFVYLRDLDHGQIWSVGHQPVGRPADAYDARYTPGCLRLARRDDGIESRLEVCVAPDADVEIRRLRLHNRSGRARAIEVTTYAEIVLHHAAAHAAHPAFAKLFVQTEYAEREGTLLARRRPRSQDEEHPWMVHALAGPGTLECETDRARFVGRGRALAAPRALVSTVPLSGTVGSVLDPIFALRRVVRLAASEATELGLVLGAAPSREAARALACEEARAFWAELLSAVQIETPLPAIDLMVNGWLGYQALACRLWARSALYQSGGAFGFRDQLQDAAAFVWSRPALTRAQILLHAEHQFVEGDVLHWWHPPTGRGIRTRFSDDLLWLPWVTAVYVHSTGDRDFLDVPAGFASARTLAPGEDEAYLAPTPAAEIADLYTHCCRALDRSLGRGAHGLPLMGTGDWNDGMNRVGREGRGESVWLGFFLYTVLDAFLPLCERRGDTVRVDRYRTHQKALRLALEEAGWDGAWYRRAYYDDGSPLGSAGNAECRIDAIAQAWAVLSGVASRERAEQAMDAVEEHLVAAADGLIRLLTPPFDRDAHDPGYIKGYLPGIRENGGQYTHAALWVVQALAELGRRDRAAPLLAMLSPVSHTATPEQVTAYQVEPYVIAADVYGVAPHVGRGGWTWYTGAAGWMYRIALESVLGLRLVGGDTLVVRPRVPDDWPEFHARFRFPTDATVYEVAVRNPSGVAATVIAANVDGQAAPIEGGAARVALVRDGGRHLVDVTLGVCATDRKGSR